MGINLNDPTIKKAIFNFAKESNMIEGVFGPKAINRHVIAIDKFLLLESITIGDLVDFVKFMDPNQRLRTGNDMVQVGNHIAPDAQTALYQLDDLLYGINNDDGKRSSFATVCHQKAECIHPFTDVNGRVFRAVWLWQKIRTNWWCYKRSFLHSYYYDTLDIFSYETM